MLPIAAGDILILNWRGDRLPNEAKKIKACVVVEDRDLFSDEHPNILVVPLTTRDSTVILQLSVSIPPTPGNGLKRKSYAPAYMIAAASKQRIDFGPIGRITQTQLSLIRAYIAESIGIA